MEKNTASPSILIIFGITGDLAKRKLLPALYHLIRAGLLPEHSQIIGVTRQNLTKDDVLKPLDSISRSNAKQSNDAIKKFKSSFHLLRMDMSKGEHYSRLKLKLDELEAKEKQSFQRLYYLSIPPSVFDDVVTLMGKSGLQKATGTQKLLPALLIEKPFGYDFASAEQLIKSTKRYFEESQLYRIDHYLAKEMAQNIFDFRFQNPLFSAVWGRRYIKRVEISAIEEIGIENRADFYEQTGALRDLIQSHLLQLLSLVATERPASLRSSTEVHAERLKVLKSIRIPKPNEVAKLSVRGQYKGYTNDVKNPRSQIETFAAIKLSIDNPRWRGVPFILKTGKSLDRKSTKIDLFFGEGSRHNRLTLQLQPNEGVYIELQVKKPGHEYQVERIQMDFGYDRAFPGIASPEAYERVLLDAIRQDQTLFASSEEVLRSWQIIEPILQEWQKTDTDLHKYAPGSHGPAIPW